MAATPFVPGTSPTPAPDFQTMLGPQPAPQPVGPTGQETGQAVITRIRDLVASVEALAAEFPASAEAARAAKQALVGMMVKIAASQREPESPAPPVIG